jgi:integrase
MNGVKHGKTMHEEILESLSPLEKKLVEVINRVEIRGKRGRRVAILLPENLKKQLDLLLEHRCVGDIDNENKHMFARPGQSRTPLRATDVLRKFSELCGAKHPETLTTTGFRKHIATMSQMLNLKDNELDVLATFLGHDVRVHREFYRLPEDTIQVSCFYILFSILLTSQFLRQLSGFDLCESLHL